MQQSSSHGAASRTSGQPRPLASNLNFSAGNTIANLVIARVGNNGEVCIFSSATTHVIADLSEWYPAVS